MFVAFNIYIYIALNTKGHAGLEKTYSNFLQHFYSPNAPIWVEELCNDCKTCQLNKPHPHQNQTAEKQDLKHKI